MDVFIDRNELARSLARVQGIIERRSTTPLLSHALLHAHPKGLRITATDTEVAYTGDSTAIIEKTGDLAVDAANLFQIVRNLPESKAQLVASGTSRLDIISGRSQFRLPGISAEDYPALPPFTSQGSATIVAADLRRLVDQTLFAVATDDTRYGLNGVHVESHPGDPSVVRFVATNGHRLSASEANYQGELTISPRMLIPRKALTVLHKLVEPTKDMLELAFSDGAVRMTREGQTFWFRLLDGEFPDYQAVLPTAINHRVVLQRRSLAAALKRVGILAQDQARPVRFSLSDTTLHVQGHDLDRGEVSEELTIEQLEGDPIELGFNIRYVSDVLAVLSSDNVQFEVSHNLGPCRIQSTDDSSAFFIVMPMRLD